jgi:hypothetical protein
MAVSERYVQQILEDWTAARRGSGAPEGRPVTERRRLPAVPLPAATGQPRVISLPARLGPGELLAASGELGCARAAAVSAALGFPVVPMHASQPAGAVAAWTRLVRTRASTRGWPTGSGWRRPTRPQWGSGGDAGPSQPRPGHRSALRRPRPGRRPGRGGASRRLVDRPARASGAGGAHRRGRLASTVRLHRAGNRVGLRSGVDWRGRHGLIVAHRRGTPVAPPTPGPGRFRWRCPRSQPRCCASWPHRRRRGPPSPSHPRVRPRRRLRAGGAGGERAAVAAALPGRRNATLNRAAFNLGQLVAAGLVDVDQVRVVLLAAALEASNPEAKARATIESGLRGGAAKPRRRAGDAP